MIDAEASGPSCFYLSIFPRFEVLAELIEGGGNIVWSFELFLDARWRYSLNKSYSYLPLEAISLINRI